MPTLVKWILSLPLMASLGIGLLANGQVADPEVDPKVQAEVDRIMAMAAATESFSLGVQYHCATKKFSSFSPISGDVSESVKPPPSSFDLVVQNCLEDDFYCGNLHRTKIDIGFIAPNPLTDDLEWTTRIFTGWSGEYIGLFSGQIKLFKDTVVWTHQEDVYDDNGNIQTDISVRTLYAECAEKDPN